MVRPLLASLAWLGRQGTRAVAVLVFFGIAFPPVDAVLKRVVPEAVFLLLCIAFVRVDTGALRRHVARPGTVLGATAWIMLALPTLLGVACVALGVGAHAPGLMLALVLQAIAPSAGPRAG